MIKPVFYEVKIMKIIKVIIRFECKYCGCIFEADSTEYKRHYNQQGTEWRTCTCPNCGKLVEQYGF